MPELPEVETIVRNLRAPLVGRTITGVEITWPRQVVKLSPREFTDRIQGQRVKVIGRRGKVLLFTLSAETLFIHLRMSGDLMVVPTGTAREKHAHIVFSLDDEHELRFKDPRKFGRVSLEDMTGKFGPEPLGSEFTATTLAKGLASHSRVLKPLLLDQTFLAGVGNIYADESLHRAGIHPLRKSDTLRPEEVSRLWCTLRRVLHSAIRHGGTDLGDRVYRDGGFRPRVYNRECRTCKTPIRRITVGQRSTRFCPRCQRVQGCGLVNPSPTSPTRGSRR